MILLRILAAALRWMFGTPIPDGQKHWDETADALARAEEDYEVLEPHGGPPCLTCRRLGRRCTDH